jgi:hypothetical protein
MHRPTCILWGNLTPSSLQLPAVEGLVAAIMPYVSLHRVRTLRWLDLSHNWIAAIPAEALVDLPALIAMGRKVIHAPPCIFS